jgi:acylphosphatase
MRACRQYLVNGRVQGVGYRMFAADAARLEGLTGVVRNLPDGRVEVVVEGEETSVDRFEAALWRGPSRARVESIEATALAPTGRGGGFIIA